MDGNPWTLAKVLLPRLPSIFYILLANRLGYSPASALQTARTELVVSIIRSLLSTPRPLSALQAFGMRDPGVRGDMWVVTARCEAPGAEVRDLVMRAARDLGGHEEVLLPDIVDVEGEWTGYRAGSTGQKDMMPMLSSEEERYRALLAECTSPTVVLYSHGGAHFMMDPISHRQLTAQLARRTGGRVFSLRYRLSPQNPFPCALLDALTAYLYLIAPPPGSFHTPIDPAHIVFAGDSAGGQLSFSLATLLVHLRRQNIQSVPFHNHSAVPLALPAAIATNSPWLDLTRASPSITLNAKYDYIDPPSPTGLFARTIPVDHIWPTTPPRAEIFCSASQLTHPLVSPITTPAELLAHYPPVWLCCGTEGLTDEDVLMAQRLDEAGVHTELVGYEGMPHCFAMIFQSSPLSHDCIARWATFISTAAEGRIAQEGKMGETSTTALWAKAKCEKPIVWEKIPLGKVGAEEVEGQYQRLKARMDELKENAVERERRLREEYFSSQKMAKL